MPLLISILAGLLPMLFFAWLLYYLDRYEREPFSLLAAVFAWGAVIAAGFAFLINTFFNLSLNMLLNSERAASLTVVTLIAPPVEEILKGGAVLLVYLLFRPEFDSALDGILYAGVTALGFAAAENILYIYQYGYLEFGWKGLISMFLIRVFLVGWQHPFYSAFFGLGLAAYRSSPASNRNWKAPILGLTAAIILHTLHNLFASLSGKLPGFIRSSIWDWTGYLGLFTYILFLIRREKRWLQEYLHEEVSQSTLTQMQYETISSLWKQGKLLWQGRIQGKLQFSKQFIQLNGELTHKKRQLHQNIAIPGTDKVISELRKEIRTLGPNLPS